ncbi:MAG: ribonuclease D [Candidatus Nanoarchaeia archaeon]|nr:ribonuclease D [Candidatus Nanoarchaeia archaeon]
MDIKFEFVNSPKKLDEACSELRKEDILGIDLECENNLHYYGVRIALIQISSKTKNYIFDTIGLLNIDPLIKIFENEKIVKIFHDVSFDFRMLTMQYNCVPKNVYDTQLAVALLGSAQMGLGELLEKYFSVKKECKFQMADWVRRPISEDMLEYAIHDTLHLIELKEILDEELKKQGKLAWAHEEFKNFEKKDWTYVQGSFEDIRGIKALSDKERAVAFEIYKLREKLAEKVNRPIHFVVGNKLLLELALHPLKTLKQWKDIKGVHPIVRLKANEFLVATLKGLNKEYKIEVEKRKRYNQTQIDMFTSLNEIKEKLSEKYKIPSHLIMNKEQMKKIVLEGNYNCLSNWQRELVETINK